jgi:site-specific DNA-cytosine methylase
MTFGGKIKLGGIFVKKYIIERVVDGIGASDHKGLSDAAHKSNEALAKLKPRIQWQESYVTGNKTFCIYLAEDEAVIREHSRLSGFPANVITEVKAVIDPATAV